jgi:hypothetical protein
MAYYGTVNGANDYFGNLLHHDAWADSPSADRPKALNEATQIIDALHYRGVKNSVWLIMYEYDANTDSFQKKLTGVPTRNEIIVADASQALEHPRGQNSSVPQTIEWANYEIAYHLIDGWTPEDTIDQLRVLRQAYSAVRTTYDNSNTAMEHLVNGVPSAKAWRWLKPYLDLDRTIRFSRAD